MRVILSEVEGPLLLGDTFRIERSLDYARDDTAMLLEMQHRNCRNVPLA